MTVTAGPRAPRSQLASDLELRGLEPLAFWMQTRLFACFYVAGRFLTVRLPAEIVADCRWASLGVWLRWLFVWLFWGILLGSAAGLMALGPDTQSIGAGRGGQ